MASLYVLSIQPYSGKSAVALGVALELSARGLAVGYMKPLGVDPDEVEGRQVDRDALFMQRTLKLSEPVEKLCPVLLTADLREAVLAGEAPALRQQVQDIYAELARGRDLMILESAGGLATGITVGLSPAEVAELTDARVLLVLKGDDRLPADDVVLAQQVLQGRLAGVVINGVSKGMQARVREEFTPFLEARGLKLFGTLPEDPLLTAITVGELADLLNAEILCCPEGREDLVQSFIVGAMGGEAAYHHLLRYHDKALITGGDRTDILMAALNTPNTKCLVLSGNLRPDMQVMNRAQELKVPIIMSKYDTTRTVAMVDDAWGHIRLSRPRPQQLERLKETVERELDFDALTDALSIKVG